MRRPCHPGTSARRTPRAVWWHLWSLSICIVLTGVATASDVPGIDTMHFRTYGTPQGMSQSTSRAIAQDRSGFVWIGTQDGLNRFDGYEFRVYKSNRDDPWSLSQNHVGALAADPDGSLWIGTLAGGLNHYDPLLDRFISFQASADAPNAIASNQVTALLIDRDDRLWVANAAGRLQWFDRAKNHLLDTPLGFNPAMRMVRSMLQSRDGRIWLGARDGLWVVGPDGSGLREVRDGSENALDVHALAQTSDGSIWAGTAESGLYEFEPDGKPLRHFEEGNSADGRSVPDRAIRALLADADGGLWIAGNNRGLARLDPARARFTPYVHDASRDHTISANRLSSLLRGRSGALFVGSWANGFSVHDPRTEVFTRIESIPGDARTLPSRQALTVWADPDGTLWVGVLEGGGLVHLDPERGVIARYQHDDKVPDSLSHDFVQFITRTRDGRLWVATMGGGLNRMRADGRGFEHYRHDPADASSLAEDSILFVYEDSAETLWVGTLNKGLDARCVTCAGFVHYPYNAEGAVAERSPGGEAIGAIVETPAGDLWLGSRAGGLDRFDRVKRTFEHFTSNRKDPLTISSDAVSTLAVDSRGELWIGTQGGGVSHLLPGSESKPRFESFGTSEGLAAGAIGAIVEDAREDLWMSTTVGVSRFDRKRKLFTNLGPHDGTLSSGYWINGATRLPGGRIVFSGLDGISVFNPLDVVMPPPPKPLATRLLLQNNPVSLRWRDPDSPLDVSLWLGGKVDLRHDQDNVTFEFAAFDYSDPESLRYSYHLEGHDTQWIETPASRRYATYTDLPAGRYRLRLRARHEGDPAAGEEFAVEIRVGPSPWASTQAWTAYVLSTLLLGALIGLQVRANLRRRAAAQEALRTSEERLKMSLWGSGSELWDMNLETGSIHRDNKLGHLAVSSQVDEETIESYKPFVHPSDLARFNAAYLAHGKGEAPAFEASYRTLNENKEWVWVLTRGRIVERDAKGRGLRMAGTTQDISALKMAESALRGLNEELESRVDRRTADLRKANVDLRETLDRLTLTQRQLLEAEKLASLGSLVAGIAHEINTPIGVSVTAASHLVQEAAHLSRQIASGELKKSDLQRFEHSALEGSRLILRNLQRADQLVKSFKQVAVDQSNEDRRVVDLAVCINEILVTLGPALKKTHHRISVVCATPVICETAPGSLYQVISNLIMNSLIHGFAEGVVGLIEIGVSRDGDHAVIDYRDNGVGMDEVTSARIFDPFFTTRRGTGGSGLGMHIVYNLVTQALAGTIVVDSSPGNGIRICIRFPAPVGPVNQ